MPPPGKRAMDRRRSPCCAGGRRGIVARAMRDRAAGAREDRRRRRAVGGGRHHAPWNDPHDDLKRALAAIDAPAVSDTLGVVLRVLQPADAGDLLELELRNRGPWRATGPLRAEHWFTLQAQRRRLEDEARDREEGRALAFGVFTAGTLTGRRGARRSRNRGTRSETVRARCSRAPRRPWDRHGGRLRGNRGRMG